eukprot:3873299-Prymnesium_polylepis.3
MNDQADCTAQSFTLPSAPALSSRSAPSRATWLMPYVRPSAVPGSGCSIVCGSWAWTQCPQEEGGSSEASGHWSVRHNLRSPSADAEKHSDVGSWIARHLTASEWADHCWRCLRCLKSKTEMSPRSPPLMTACVAAEYAMQLPPS